MFNADDFTFINEETKKLIHAYECVQFCNRRKDDPGFDLSTDREERLLREHAINARAEDGLILPPWICYPLIPQGSMMWRMGEEDAYLTRWFDFLRNLPVEKLAVYYREFPCPAEFVHWSFGALVSERYGVPFAAGFGS